MECNIETVRPIFNRRELMRILLVFCTLLLISDPLPSIAGEAYKLSMLPRYSSEEINRRISPLAEYLSQLTGSPIEPVVTSDFSQYEKQLKSGAIAMGYENPYIYTLVSETHEALAMAVKGKDGDKFRGIVIARHDKGLSTLADLRGRTIAIVGYTSAGGYLSQKLSLMQIGIDVAKDCTIVEAVDNKQENVILAVYTGGVDAGFIRESALHQADDFISPAQLMVVGESAWLPNWAFSVDRHLSDALKKEIRSALLQLKPDHPVMKALKIDKFQLAVDSDYQPVRLAAGLQ
jgi:phosphonate transport system substrate-binding protein